MAPVLNEDCLRNIISYLEGDYETLRSLLVTNKLVFLCTLETLYKNPFCVGHFHSGFQIDDHTTFRPANMRQLEWLISVSSGYSVYMPEPQPTMDDYETEMELRQSLPGPTSVNYLKYLGICPESPLFPTKWIRREEERAQDWIHHLQFHGEKIRHFALAYPFLRPVLNSELAIKNLKNLKSIEFCKNYWPLQVDEPTPPLTLPIPISTEQATTMSATELESLSYLIPPSVPIRRSDEINMEDVKEFITVHQKLFPGVLQGLMMESPGQGGKDYALLINTLIKPTTIKLYLKELSELKDNFAVENLPTEHVEFVQVRIVGSEKIGTMLNLGPYLAMCRKLQHVKFLYPNKNVMRWAVLERRAWEKKWQEQTGSSLVSSSFVSLSGSNQGNWKLSDQQRNTLGYHPHQQHLQPLIQLKTFESNGHVQILLDVMDAFRDSLESITHRCDEPFADDNDEDDDESNDEDGAEGEQEDELILPEDGSPRLRTLTVREPRSTKPLNVIKWDWDLPKLRSAYLSIDRMDMSCLMRLPNLERLFLRGYIFIARPELAFHWTVPNTITDLQVWGTVTETFAVESLKELVHLEVLISENYDAGGFRAAHRNQDSIPNKILDMKGWRFPKLRRVELEGDWAVIYMNLLQADVPNLKYLILRPTGNDLINVDKWAFKNDSLHTLLMDGWRIDEKEVTRFKDCFGTEAATSDNHDNSESKGSLFPNLCVVNFHGFQIIDEQVSETETKWRGMDYGQIVSRLIRQPSSMYSVLLSAFDVEELSKWVDLEMITVVNDLDLKRKSKDRCVLTYHGRRYLLKEKKKTRELVSE